MAPELPETILVSVSTSLDTRLVVIPLRTETVAGLRATIKDYHMSLFPDFGEVDVSSIEVQLFGAKSRLADPISIGQLFFNDLQASLFAELTVRKVNIPRDRPNFARSAASDGQLIALSPWTGRQADGQAKVRQGREQNSILTSARQSKRKVTEPASDDGNGGDSRSPRRRNVGDFHSQARKEKSGETGILSPAKDMCTADAAHQHVTREGNEQMTERSAVKLGLSEPAMAGDIGAFPSQGSEKDAAVENVLKIDSSQKFQEADKLKLRTDCPAATDVLDGAQSASHLNHKENTVHGRPLTSPSEPLRKASVRESTLPAESRREKGVVKGSNRDDNVDHVGSEILHRDTGLVSGASPEIDLVVRSLLGMEPGNQNANDGSVSQSVLGDEPAKNLKKKPHKAPPVATSKEGTRRTSVVAISTPKSNSRLQSGRKKSGTQSGSKQDGIANEDRADSTVPAQNVLSPRILVKETAISVISGNRSGQPGHQKPSVSTSSSDTGKRSEGSKGRNVDLLYKDPRNNECSSGRAAPSEGHTIVDLLGSSQCEETTSESDSSEQSSTESASHDRESSSQESDETEGLAPIASRIRSRRATVNGIGSKRRSSGRTVGGPLDPKYQHLLESQDGFDELINLSQQNVQVITGHSEGRKSVDQHRGSGVPTRAEDISSDLPSGNPNAIQTVARGHKDKFKADKRIDETSPPSNPVLDDKLIPPEHLQAKHGVETLGSKSRVPRSEEAADGENQDPVAKMGSLSKRSLEPGQDSPQKGSEDSLQMKAAEQLARMSGPDNKADEPEIGPNLRKARTQRITSVEDVSRMQDSDLVVDIADDGPLPKHLALSQRSSDGQTSDDHGGNAAPFEYRDLRSSGLATAYQTGDKGVDVKKTISTMRLAHRDNQVPSASSHEEPASGEDMQDNRDSERVTPQDNHKAPDQGHNKRASAKLGGTRQQRKSLPLETGVGHVGKERKSKSVGKAVGHGEARMSGDDAKESIPHMMTEIDRNGATPDVLTRQESRVPGPGEDAPSTQLPDAQRSEDVVVTETATEKKKKRKSVTESAENPSKLKPSKKKAPDENRRTAEPPPTDQVVRVDSNTEIAQETNLGKLDGDKAVNDSQNNFPTQEKVYGELVVFRPNEKKKSRRKSGQAATETNIVEGLADEPLSPSLNRDRRSKSSKPMSDNHAKGPECRGDERDIHPPADIVQDEVAFALADEHLTPPRLGDTEVLLSNVDNQAKTKKKREKSKTLRNEQAKVADKENGKVNEQVSKVREETRVHSSVKRRRSNAEDVEDFNFEDKSRKVKSPIRKTRGDEDPEIGLSPTNALDLNLGDSPAKRVKRRRRNEADKQNLSDGEHTPADEKKHKAGTEDLDSENDFQDMPTPDKKQSQKKGQKGNSKSRTTSPLEEPVACPYNCGKVYSKRTSTYFRHRKQCALAQPEP